MKINLILERINMSDSTWKVQNSRRTRRVRTLLPNISQEEFHEIIDEKSEFAIIIRKLTRLMNSKVVPTDEDISEYSTLSYRAARLCNIMGRDFDSYRLSYDLYQKKFSHLVPYWKFWFLDRKNNKKNGICDPSTLPTELTYGRCKICECSYSQSDINYDEKRSVYQQQCNNCAIFIGKMKGVAIGKYVADWTTHSDRTVRENGQTMWNWLKYLDQNNEVTTVRGCWGSSLFDTELGILVLTDEEKEKYKFETRDSICDWCAYDLLRNKKIKHIVHNQL